ncbi:glycosyltransferase [Luteipulveratus mongoliensis]|uniref:Glycosyltransferase n=1 Tax=Luteipulveratus mongoliensis TaxID=571913 RepID=A0A0K1JRJ7_9MICO|nr:glycosyltransferase [Luteipulveratus mongoliensis]
MTTMVVIAKEPVPGRVKTRLTSRVSPDAAARVAMASLLDTLDEAARVPAERHVLLLAGRPGLWLPSGWDVVPQTDGGLDHRIATGLAKLPTGSALLVGMDTPQLTAGLLANGMPSYDACLGRATDGGFWALGLSDSSLAPELVEGVPMSTDRTGAAQLERLNDAGLRVQHLSEIRDVDTPADADAVAALAPTTRFARAWREATA